MGKGVSIAAAAVPWVLAAFGFPLPVVVTGGLATLNAVLNALPPREKALKDFVAKAASDLDNSCADEFRALGEADKDIVHEWLIARFESVDREATLGAALLGRDQFSAALLGESLPHWDADRLGYLHAVATQVHSVVLQFAQSRDVLGKATTAALRMIVYALATRPTHDEVRRMIEQAVMGELALRPIIAGSRPRLAAGFVARDEMAALRSALGEGGVATICALAGMRGVGKSQLASAFAQEAEEARWPFVGWVSAESRTQVVSQLADIALTSGVSKETEPEKAAKALLVWLNGQSGDRLLVFDNVERQDDLEGWLPRGPGMRVIVTSTAHTLTLGTPVPVEVYSPDQAVEFLLDQTRLDDRVGAATLAEDLGRLPVALTQAAAGIRLWGLDFTSYQEELAQQPLDGVMLRSRGEPYPSKVGAALHLAYTKAVQRIADDHGPSAADAASAILAAMTLLADSGVPRAWVMHATEDTRSARTAVGALLENSILTLSEDGSLVALHRLQSQVIREDLDCGGSSSAPQEAALRVLCSAKLDAGGYPTQRETLALLATQLLSILAQPNSHAWAESPAILSLAASAIYQSNQLVYPNVAIELAEFVDVTARVLGPNHYGTLASRHNLASAYEAAGQYALAILLHETLVTDTEEFLGRNHPDTLTSRNNLACAYQADGRFDAAISLHKTTLSDRSRTLGADHQDTLTSRHNLAFAYQESGQPDVATPLYVSVLADRIRVLGRRHPDTLSTRNNLANTYQQFGKLDRVIPLLESTVSDAEHVFGHSHPYTLTSRNNLAVAYETDGQLSLAVPLYEATLRDRISVLGHSHPETLTSRNNLGIAYWKQGLHTEALLLLEEAASVAERVLGSAHPLTTQFISNRDNARQALTQGDSDDRSWNIDSSP
ncbi:tetratricopeptide repeat protein [Propioniciclava flava]|uniref:tetratricopeptide repeat protein n=1 Tax=Propioniciclava flava TaxID=2072026 RepID=UPI001012F84E|nr:tetratricopeptide repeat protein [Propioniciclava flava]